jgi:HTH-type transcriptional regulator/antitoxin HigA
MPTVLDPTVEMEYLALVRAFPLVSIRDDEHLEEALAVVDRLVEQTPRSTAEEAYLGALTDLVETYEDAHVIIPPTSGVEAVRYLMEENGLTQAELVPFFGTPSVVSAVLAGKRRLALSHIRRLSAHFGVPADVFIDGGDVTREDRDETPEGE